MGIDYARINHVLIQAALEIRRNVTPMLHIQIDKLSP